MNAAEKFKSWIEGDNFDQETKNELLAIRNDAKEGPARTV